MRRAPVLAALLALAAAAPAAAAEHSVTFTSFSYTPASLQIGAGDTVSFSGDFGFHPLVWDTGDFPRADSDPGPLAFPKPGTYAYHCDVHGASGDLAGSAGGGMTGRLVVPGNQHAVANFSATVAGGDVTYSYTGGEDPDGTLVRFDWDLDGNGTFETHTTARSVQRSYAAGTSVDAGLRAVDDGHVPSATVRHAVAVASSGGGSGGGGGGTPSTTTPPSSPSATTTAPGADTTEPVATFASVARRLRAGALVVRLRTDEPATAVATLTVNRRRVARTTSTLPAAGTHALRLRLTKAARATLRRRGRLTATLRVVITDAAGNARTLRRTVTFRE